MLDSNLFTHRNTYAILRQATSETYGPRVYLLSYKLSIYFYFHLYFSNLYHKIPKIYLSYHTISIRSHFCKWPWRDWQPLYSVGCKVLICLCRYEGLACGLLLDWYLGSQKLREILMLLCCITLSSSRENQRSAQEVAMYVLHVLIYGDNGISHDPLDVCFGDQLASSMTSWTYE